MVRRADIRSRQVNLMKPRTLPMQGPALARVRELSAVALLLVSATTAQAQVLDCTAGTQRPLLRHEGNYSSCIHEKAVQKDASTQSGLVIAILGANQGTFLPDAAVAEHFTISLSIPGLSVKALYKLETDPDAPEGGETGIVAANLELELDGDITRDTTFHIEIDPGALSGSAKVSTSTMTLVASRTLSFSPVSAEVDEGDSGTRDMTFTVTLDEASPRTVTVDYASADETATAGSDYAAARGTLTFAPGTTTQTFTVAVYGDREIESDEDLTVTLSNPTSASTGGATATATIANDDDASDIQDANEEILPELSRESVALAVDALHLRIM